MSSNKTTNLNLHSWTGSDKVLRSEFVDNFNKIDAKFNASNGHSHDGTAGSGGKISATSVNYTSEKNVKEALDELFQSANRYIKSIADTIGEPYDSTGSATIYRMGYYSDRTFEEKLKIVRAITAKHGYVGYNDNIAQLKQRILDIPYNLEPQGTADAIDVAKGETFLNRTASLITGTRELLTNKEYSPSTTNTSIPNAIHENSIIKGEGQLVPANIKNGTTIFGVTGSYVPTPGYNTGDEFDYSYLVNSYVVSHTEAIAANKLVAVCPQSCVWAANKEVSQYKVQNLNYPTQVFYFTPYTDIKSMTIDFNGIYFLTQDMIYCYDYLKLTHKWGVTLTSFVASGDTIVGVCTNHLGEVIVVTQKGRIYVLNYSDGDLKDMYKIQEEYTYPINISKVRQRFSCDDIILIDNDNKLSLYIDSDVNGDNNTRVLYWSKNTEIADIITTDTQNSFILKRKYSGSTPIKRAYIETYNYREASSITVATSIGEVPMKSVPERIYRIENYTFLITSPTEIIVYDAITDLVLLQQDFGYEADSLVVSNGEDIYGNNKVVSLSKSTNLVKYVPPTVLVLEGNEETNSKSIDVSAKDTKLEKIL